MYMMRCVDNEMIGSCVSRPCIDYEGSEVYDDNDDDDFETITTTTTMAAMSIEITLCEVVVEISTKIHREK